MKTALQGRLGKKQAWKKSRLGKNACRLFLEKKPAWTGYLIF
jgi:hypothetical protein